MDQLKAKALISILIDSPLYLTLSLEERNSLLLRLAASYPCLFSAQGTDSGNKGTDTEREYIQ
jgi:hypothetical protein